MKYSPSRKYIRKRIVRNLYLTADFAIMVHMVTLLLIFLVILFILGYIQLPFLTLQDTTLFIAFGRSISLYDLLVFALILWVIGMLPWPFRGLASIVLILWILAFFGIIAISGFSNILVLALIIGVIAYVFQGFGKR